MCPIHAHVPHTTHTTSASVPHTCAQHVCNLLARSLRTPRVRPSHTHTHTPHLGYSKENKVPHHHCFFLLFSQSTRFLCTLFSMCDLLYILSMSKLLCPRRKTPPAPPHRSHPGPPSTTTSRPLRAPCVPPTLRFPPTHPASHVKMHRLVDGFAAH